jgi:hypothetical protein
MPTADVTVTWDRATLNRFLVETTNALALSVSNLIVNRARHNIMADDLINTGALLRSVEARLVSKTPNGTTYLVGSDLPQGHYQEVGYPYRIYPKRAKALRFKPKGSSTYIFRASTRGYDAHHWLERTLDGINSYDFRP